MIRRIVTTLALAACTLAPLNSHAMSIFRKSGNTPTSASVPQGKMVKVTLRNKTASPMDVLVNDKVITIAANGDYELKAPEGTDIYNADKSELKVHVTRELNGNAVSFR